MPRTASVHRKTSETEVRVTINLDGRGESRIATGIAFLDHMLTLFAKHGLFDLELECRGDMATDTHHSVEDIGISMGQAFAQALSEKRGIVRFGHAYVPMDEALVRAVADLSGRAFVVYNVASVRERIGDFEVEMAEHFWRSFGDHARCNLHFELLYGKNQHHILEGVFKAAAKALSQAASVSERVEGVLSTKGVL